MVRILIAEDEPGIALGLRNELLAEGYEVEVARDGKEALERAQLGRFDLMLLDLMMPGKDGYTVCRELRASGSQTPILMLTARAMEAEKVLGLELGADDYVTKPFSSLELRARVRALLRRSAGNVPEVYRFGEIEVDLTRAEVRRGGEPLELTLLEYKLLTTFLKRKGRILTREQLLDEVWRPDSSPTDRVIDNHVMNLRRKIGDDSQQPRLLVSVRGLGYRFDA